MQTLICDWNIQLPTKRADLAAASVAELRVRDAAIGGGGVCLYHCPVGIYPPKIQERSVRPSSVGRAEGENARGKDASFVCGTMIVFSLAIRDKTIVEAAFQTNGCGYMTAAADVLCGAVKGRDLGDLHGLGDAELGPEIFKALGPFPEGRSHCVETVFSALRAAFSDHRARLIKEFAGETALICTCFGVTEETIERLIATSSPGSVEEVTTATRAGGGCGSCRMLIQEMIDLTERGSQASMPDNT